MNRKLQVYRTDELVVTFDPTLCIHAADCIRELPAVFDTSRVAWIRPGAAPAEEVVKVVGRCPTGALHAVRRGVPAVQSEPPAELPGGERRVRVEVTDTGPVVIRGPVEFEPEPGRREPRDGALAICRCGRSANLPFCDGSHAGA